MNRVVIIGNLTRDPETATTSGGIQKCSFTVAVQRRFAGTNGEKQTDFIPVVAWRQLAELCGRYLAKGRKVGVEGSIQTRSYDAQDGTKRYVTEIIADGVEFLGSREGGEQQSAPPAAPARRQDDFEEVDDDELPF